MWTVQIILKGQLIISGVPNYKYSYPMRSDACETSVAAIPVKTSIEGSGLICDAGNSPLGFSLPQNCVRWRALVSAVPFYMLFP
jgi:hypothetical protein